MGAVAAASTSLPNSEAAAAPSASVTRLQFPAAALEFSSQLFSTVSEGAGLCSLRELGAICQQTPPPSEV